MTPCLLCAVERGLCQSAAVLQLRYDENEYRGGIRRGLVGGFIVGAYAQAAATSTMCFEHRRDVEAARAIFAEFMGVKS